MKAHICTALTLGLLLVGFTRAEGPSVGSRRGLPSPTGGDAAAPSDPALFSVRPEISGPTRARTTVALAEENPAAGQEGPRTTKSLGAITITDRLESADEKLQAGRADQAFSDYLIVLDDARATGDELTLEAEARVDDVLREVPNMPEAQLDAVEAALPTWEALQTDQAKGGLMRFVDTRRKRYALEGDTANARETALSSRDMSWSLIEANSSASVIRAAVKIYRYATETLGEFDEGKRKLLEQASALKPSPAKFCIVYWAAQDVAKAGDAVTLAKHCRTLLDIYEKGALAPALTDRFGARSDKLLMEYHVAYAQFVLGRLDDALKQCDLVLEKYADVIDHRREEHGALAMTALLRAMTLAAQAADDPAAAIAVYDAFLAKYPDRPQAAFAWMHKGTVYAREGNRAKAVACYDQAIAHATHPDAADAARESTARRAELTAAIGK